MTSTRHHPDKAWIDAARQLTAAALLLLITIIAPIVAGHTHGWITVFCVLTGVAALVCAYAAGINIERWSRP